MSTPIRVLIVDDHPMVAEGIEAILDTYDDIDIVGTASDGRSAIDLAVRLSPDVVLMDLNMPGVNGLSATELILEQCPGILSVH